MWNFGVRPLRLPIAVNRNIPRVEFVDPKVSVIDHTQDTVVQPTRFSVNRTLDGLTGGRRWLKRKTESLKRSYVCIGRYGFCIKAQSEADVRCEVTKFKERWNGPRPDEFSKRTER
ncbi:hypothetical protein TREMEDRAFT_61264 [Tremella mesenterica DSM 1558]|uniref:uncharacterized protein n=1 Tax=Tremella mesenterica (strain ATCC 24925 / CBS 8224 / DSM 1558 / NBRC 9311 / NRRL Y-6157 / RJB 2259-6 / UBC 559-6) TaxID=578456 RepID=UPI0003F49A1B|nr:uncharacterized protein TREMEDRAFT_61264 [Tremella mesenterica DSM 1558]EIW70757.1 hypothetical protein TREMEDRAFT_61264 [Tremella mesenterica DSM 1558]